MPHTPKKHYSMASDYLLNASEGLYDIMISFILIKIIYVSFVTLPTSPSILFNSRTKVFVLMLFLLVEMQLSKKLQHDTTKYY